MTARVTNPMRDLPEEFSPVLRIFMQQLLDSLGTTVGMKIISVPETTGDDDVLDEFSVDHGTAAFYFCYARSGVNSKASIIHVDWLSDGTLPSGHGQMDVTDIGDTTDLSFEFSYDSDSGKIQWLATATGTYRVKALRILL